MVCKINTWIPAIGDICRFFSRFYTLLHFSSFNINPTVGVNWCKCHSFALHRTAFLTKQQAHWKAEHAEVSFVWLTGGEEMWHEASLTWQPLQRRAFELSQRETNMRSKHTWQLKKYTSIVPALMLLLWPPKNRYSYHWYKTLIQICSPLHLYEPLYSYWLYWQFCTVICYLCSPCQL